MRYPKNIISDARIKILVIFSLVVFSYLGILGAVTLYIFFDPSYMDKIAEEIDGLKLIQEFKENSTDYSVSDVIVDTEEMSGVVVSYYVDGVIIYVGKHLIWQYYYYIPECIDNCMVERFYWE